MLAFVPPNHKLVLDIGCGTGGFISSIPDCHERWGIEPTNAGLAAKDKLTHLLSATFDDAKHQLPRKYFDLVICNDVIEHMIDHRAFLTELREYIAPNGMLIGSLPNILFYNTLFRMLLEKDWKYTDAGILDRTHLAFFTEKSLRETLGATGYQVVSTAGLHRDHVVEKTRKNFRYLRLARALSKISFGHFSDIRFFQLAFQARPVG
jgi:2-polyprenyl-3-methyl-5-hydroxy-6-metoxy-1,4-benzoquinol methylase